MAPPLLQSPRAGKLVLSANVALATAERLDELAAENDRCRSEEIRLALDEYVHRHDDENGG